MPPMSTPSAMAWMNEVIAAPPQPCPHGPRCARCSRSWRTSLPVGLRGDHSLRRRGFRRGDDLGLAGLPLRKQELAVGLAGGLPAQRAEDGLHSVRVQPVADLRLVQGADLGDGLL